jgi:hypothetical protein
MRAEADQSVQWPHYALDDSRQVQLLFLLNSKDIGSEAHQSFLPRSQAAGPLSWPLTSSLFLGKERLELYLHASYIFMTWCY